MFFPLFLGGVLGVVIYLLYFNPDYERQIPIHRPKMVPPEVRLKPAFYGGPLLMISFLWFGWTSYPSIPLWAPLMSGLAMGVSVVFIFVRPLLPTFLRTDSLPAGLNSRLDHHVLRS